MSTTIKLKRNETNASKSSSTEILAQGEPAFDKVDGALYIGDGESTIAELNTAKKYFVQRTNGSVVSDMIADNAVITSKILDENVTSAKLASNAVTTGKIASGAVTTGKIAGGAVTIAKLYGATTSLENPTMDEYVDEKVEELIEQGIQISASELVITEQSGSTTKDVIRAVRTDGAEPISTGTATIGGFTVHYNGLTGDNTTRIIGTKISSASTSPKFEINANTTGNAFLTAKNSSNSTVTSISSAGVLSATNPVIKIGSTSGNIITTDANGQLQSSASISGDKVTVGSTANQVVITGTGGVLTSTTALPSTISLKVGSTTGKIVTTTTNGVLTASDYISGSQVRVGSTSGKYLITTTNGALTTADTIDWSKITISSYSNRVLATTAGVSYSNWAALPTVNGTKSMVGTGAVSSFYAPETSGTSGQILQSAGANAIPTWVNTSSISAGSATNANKIRININGTNKYCSATLTGSTLSFA